MSNIKPFDQSELIRLALAGLDTQIAELQEKRAQLAALTIQQPANATVKAVVPQQKSGKMSEEAKAKISAAAKARWARVKQEQAKTKKAQSAPVKAKKSPAKKGKSKPVAAAVKAESVKATS